MLPQPKLKQPHVQTQEICCGFFSATYALVNRQRINVFRVNTLPVAQSWSELIWVLRGNAERSNSPEHVCISYDVYVYIYIWRCIHAFMFTGFYTYYCTTYIYIHIYTYMYVHTTLYHIIFVNPAIDNVWFISQDDSLVSDETMFLWERNLDMGWSDEEFILNISMYCYVSIDDALIEVWSVIHVYRMFICVLDIL